MDDAKKKSRAQEELLALYLRLNGFFVTGHIIHSPDSGRVVTEVDVLAVRFPYHREPETQNAPDAIIETSDQLVDLVICEAKSKGQKLQFNSALQENGEMVKLLRRAGLHQESEIPELASQICSVLKPADPPRTEIPTVVGPRNTRIRGLLCSPERDNRRNNQAWFLPGSAMLRHISRCLCGKVPGCARNYGASQWGRDEPAARYFKERGANNPGTIEDFYAAMSSTAKMPPSAFT